MLSGERWCPVNGAVVLLIALAVGLIGLGAQVLSTRLHRFPTDIRRPGPLVRVRRSKPSKVHSPELRRLVTVISYTVLDDPSSKVELNGLFEALDAPVSPLVDTEQARSGRARRSQQLENAIEALEQRYELE